MERIGSDNPMATAMAMIARSPRCAIGTIRDGNTIHLVSIRFDGIEAWETGTSRDLLRLEPVDRTVRYLTERRQRMDIKNATLSPTSTSQRLIGKRVRTSHGPTGRDDGTIISISFAEVVRIGGETLYSAPETPVMAFWCNVRLDSGTEMFLDWRTDGYGRLVLIDA